MQHPYTFVLLFTLAAVLVSPTPARGAALMSMSVSVYWNTGGTKRTCCGREARPEISLGQSVDSS